MQGRFSSRLIRHISRGIIASLLLSAAALLICGVCIYRQGQAGEIHSSDAIAVISEHAPQAELDAATQARLDSAIELYQQNYGRIILLPGDPDLSSDAQPAYAYLLRHGISQDVILVYSAEPGLPGMVRGLGAASGERGLGSLLLVSDPALQLRALKIAQDQRIAAFSMPVQANRPAGTWSQFSELWDESWGYLAYLLFNQ